MPLPKGRLVGTRDGSSLTEADVAWLISNEFRRVSRKCSAWSL
jgi:hypothetical protein